MTTNQVDCRSIVRTFVDAKIFDFACNIKDGFTKSEIRRPTFDIYLICILNHVY